MERWLDVVGFKGFYSVSSNGRIRRECSGKSTRVGRILKPILLNNGYVSVSLFKNGARKPRTIHGLVVESFLGDRAVGVEVNHIDGDKENNSLENLEYVTRSENMKHAFRIGLNKARDQRGEKSTTAKLKNKEVMEIRRRYANGCTTQRNLGKEFNVSYQLIEKIVNNKIWINLLGLDMRDSQLRKLDN